MRPEHFKRRKTPCFIVGQTTRWLAILASVLVLACLIDWFVSQRNQPAAPSQPLSSSSSRARSSAEPLQASRDVLPPVIHEGRSGRVVYPYSVIPGGIQSIQDLKNAIAKDPVVSAHYATFRLEDARIIRLDRERSMHVSYRLDNQVYWTKRKLKLLKGETLVTDGVQTARTRCGNMISETIVAQAFPNEPTLQELNTPAESRYVPGEPGSDDRFHKLKPEPEPELEPNAPPGRGPSSGGGTGPFIYIPSGPAGPILSPAVHAPPPVVSTPEPGTAIQLLTSLVVLFFLLRRRPKDAPKIAS